MESSSADRNGPRTREAAAAHRKQLRQAVTSGRLGLGQALIELETTRTRDRERTQQASAAYATLLAAVRERLAHQPQDPASVVEAELRRRGLRRHKALNRRLSDALLGGGGDCQARTRLIASLLYDAGLGQRVGARVFANHIAPVLRRPHGEHHFGMVAACTGLGVLVPAVSLLNAELPASADRCRDQRPLYGAGIGAADPPPAWSGEEPKPEKHCPLPRWPWRETGTEVGVSVGTELLPGWHERPALRLQVTALDLEEYSAGIECHQRWLAQQRRLLGSPVVKAPFVAKAVGYFNEAALAFAAGGELEIARKLESDLERMAAEAEDLLSDPEWETARVRHEHWSLIFLGAAGQQRALRLAASDESWFASNLLAVLIRETATRARALEIFEARSRPGQVEAAERAHWNEARFETELERFRVGRFLLSLRHATELTRGTWELRTCTIQELERSAHDSAARFAIGSEYVPAIVTIITEPAVVVDLDRRGCDPLVFLASRDRWLRAQPREIRDFAAGRAVAGRPL